MAVPRSGDSNRRPLSQSASESSVTSLRRRRRRSKSTNPVVPSHEAVIQSASEGDEAVLHSFSQRNPLWVTVLVKLQQGSFPLTFALIVAAMVIYGWTVYIQQRWGQEYEKLEALKKQERQLISANEVLKNQMAEQAESPTAGLLLPNPNNTIFLAPAPLRPPVKPGSPPVSPTNSSPKRPLGY